MKKIISILVVILLVFMATPVMAAPDYPLLLISEVRFNTESVTPGSNFIMSVVLVNHGEYNAYNTTVDVKNLSGAQDLGVFSMTGSGNHFYLGRINAGSTEVIDIPMMVAPNAEAKNYNLDLEIRCVDGNDQQYKFPETVGIAVNESNSMSLISLDKLMIEDGAPSDNLKIEISNFGTNVVRGVHLKLSSDNPEVEISNTEEYYGTYEKNNTDTFITSVNAKTPGDYKVKATLYYVDSFNNQRSIEKEIEVHADTATEVETEQSANSNPFVDFIKALFGIA